MHVVSGVRCYVTGTDGRCGGAKSLLRSRSRQHWSSSWIRPVHEQFARGVRRQQGFANRRLRGPPWLLSGPAPAAQWRFALTLVQERQKLSIRKGLDKDRPHGRGAWGNAAMAELGTHLVTERARLVTLRPPPTAGAPQLYPNKSISSSKHREIAAAVVCRVIRGLGW